MFELIIKEPLQAVTSRLRGLFRRLVIPLVAAAIVFLVPRTFHALTQP